MVVPASAAKVTASASPKANATVVESVGAQPKWQDSDSTNPFNVHEDSFDKDEFSLPDMAILFCLGI